MRRSDSIIRLAHGERHAAPDPDRRALAGETGPSGSVPCPRVSNCARSCAGFGDHLAPGGPAPREEFGAGLPASDGKRFSGRGPGFAEPAVDCSRGSGRGQDREPAHGRLPRVRIGHIVFQAEPRKSGLWALAFLRVRGRRKGSRFPLSMAARTAACRSTETLAWSPTVGEWRHFVWWDRSGKKLSESGAPDQIESVALSPDASRVSYCSTQGNFDVWILDLIRQTKSRFTLTPRVDVSARWSPSGKEIAWGSVRGPVDIYVQPSDGSGEPKRVISGPDGAHKYPSRWSPDGSTLLLHVFGLTAGDDVYYAKRRADGAFDEPVAFLNTAFSEDAAQFSPDGRFVAYSSDKSGRREGYVRSFPMREASVRSRPMAATYHAGAAAERRSST